MTTPPPIKISDEMIGAYSSAIRDLCNAAHRADNDQPSVLEGIRAGLGAVAPLIAAQVLRQQPIEWGVQWHDAGVIHGRGDLGREPYDEESARATADRYANAKAVFRHVAGPWTECPHCYDSGSKCGYCGTGLWPNEPENGRERSLATGGVVDSSQVYIVGEGGPSPLVVPTLCREPNPHKDGYVCHRAAGHVPEGDHRYGPGVSGGTQK